MKEQKIQSASVCLRFNPEVHKEAVPASRVSELFEQNMIDACMIEIMEALQMLHESGIVHADIRPENIYLSLSSEGDIVPVITGLEKSFPQRQPRPYEEISLNRYSAPETALYVKHKGGWSSAQRITVASDQYSLGILWYEMLSGRMLTLPPECSTPYEAVLKGKDVSLSSKVDRLHRSVLSRMLEPEPENRYKDMKEIILDFTTAVNAEENFHQPAEALMR